MNIVIALLMIGTMAAFLGGVLTWLICLYHFKLKHIGKSWVLILPETVGTEATVMRTKLKDGKVDMPSRNHDAKRGDMDRLLPQGNVAYQARGAISGPLHVMTSYGSNLVAPPKLEAAKVIEKVAVADWVADYKRLPKDEKEQGLFAERLKKAWDEAKLLATRFLVWDPLAYYKACDENDMQDFLNSNGGAKDPWYAKAAFVAIVIVGGLMLLLLAVVMMRILPALQASAGA